MKRCMLMLALVLGLPLSAWAVIETQNKEATIETWLTISTNIASGGRAISGNVTMAATGFLYGKCEMNTPSWSGTPAANSSIAVWLCSTADGTNFEDCSTGADPARLPDAIFPLANVAGAQRLIRRNVVLPAGLFRVLAKNDGTGVTLQGATSAATFKCVPTTPQGVIK